MKAPFARLLWACIGTLLATVAVVLTMAFLFLNRRGTPFPVLLGMFQIPLLVCVICAAAAGYLLARYAAVLAEADALVREERLRRFLNDTGHELRTPLTVFNSSLVLLKQIQPEPSPHAAPIFAALEQEALRLWKLVNDLLLLARLGVVRTARLEHIAVEELVAEVAAEAFAAHGLVVQLELQAGLQVQASRVELREVLVNLLDNVARHASDSNVRISALHDLTKKKILITVNDDGPGMSEEECKLAFEPFFRGDAAMTKPGAGLGLAIVRSAVTRASGSISLESRTGAGLSVRIALPAG